MNDNTVTSDGFDVSSSSETPEEIQASLNRDEPKEEVAKTESVEAEPAEAESVEEKPPVEEGRNKKARHDPAERVRMAAREAKEAKQRAEDVTREKDEISRRAEEYRLELEKIRVQTKPKEPDSSGKPKSTDFHTYEEFTEALAEWKFNENIQKLESNRRMEAIERETAHRFSSFEKKIKEHMDADPTFKDRISPDVLNLRPLSAMAPGEPRGPLNALAEHFLVSEVAPKLIEYFSEHEDELQRFSTLHPLRFGVELGKVEERLSVGSSTATAPVEMSKAKPPVRPVTGGPPIVDKDLPDDAPFEKFFVHENAKERKSGSRW